MNLLVSFSGGETSALMCYIIKTKSIFTKRYKNIIFVMANTGEENEETLLFAEQVNKYFDLNLTFVETIVHHGERVACTHRTLAFDLLSRQGEPFEEVIKKYGIPNSVFPHCTRELKTRPSFWVYIYIAGDTAVAQQTCREFCARGPLCYYRIT